MNRQFISYGLAIALPQVISFATLLVLSSHLGNELYAKIAIFETIIFFLQATIGLAIGRSASRFYIDDGAYIISVASTVVIISSIVLFLLSTVVFRHFDLLVYLGISYEQYTMLYVSSLGYILTAISLVKYQFTNQAVKYLLLSVLKTALLFVAIFGSIKIFEMNAEAFPISHFFVGLILVGVALFINKPIALTRFDMIKVRSMLVYSLPFLPTLIAAWIMSWSNRFFMVNEISLDDIGLFSIIQRFCMVYFIFTQAVSVFITPIIYRKLKKDLSSRVSILSMKLMALYLFVSCALIPALTYFLVWNYDYDYEMTIAFVAMLIIVNLLASITAVSTNILFNYYKKTLIQMYIYLCISIVALALNYFLIPQFKMYGVFVSLIIPLVILNFIHTLYFSVETKYRNLGKVLFLITVLLTFIAIAILTYADSF